MGSKDAQKSTQLHFHTLSSIFPNMVPKFNNTTTDKQELTVPVMSIYKRCVITQNKVHVTTNVSWHSLKFHSNLRRTLFYYDFPFKVWQYEWRHGYVIRVCSSAGRSSGIVRRLSHASCKCHWNRFVSSHSTIQSHILSDHDLHLSLPYDVTSQFRIHHVTQYSFTSLSVSRQFRNLHNTQWSSVWCRKKYHQFSL
jgi:hypothetical protein